MERDEFKKILDSTFIPDDDRRDDLEHQIKEALREGISLRIAPSTEAHLTDLRGDKGWGYVNQLVHHHAPQAKFPWGASLAIHVFNIRKAFKMRETQ